MSLTDISKTAHDSRHFWLMAGPISGGIVIAIFVIARCMSAVNEPPPDLEKAAARSDVNSESETP
jgi:hypothetical protein